MFTREKYFQELQSQLSASSGYSSLESLPVACRTPKHQLITSQSLGIVILLTKTAGNLKIVKKLQTGAWKFHHTMQLLDWENSEVIAKQDFFELGPDLPLISSSITLAGKNIIRFNLFVRNKKKMQRFYEDVLQIYPSLETPDYCCFVLKTTEQFEVQFSLKLSRHLDITSAKSSRLMFYVPNICRFFCRSVRRRNVVETCDPEGNSLILLAAPRLWVSGREEKQEMKRTEKSKRCQSTTRLGDCSIIRTRSKTSGRSSSTCESDTSSLDSVGGPDGIIFSGCPIML